MSSRRVQDYWQQHKQSSTESRTGRPRACAREREHNRIIGNPPSNSIPENLTSKERRYLENDTSDCSDASFDHSLM